MFHRTTKNAKRGGVPRGVQRPGWRSRSCADALYLAYLCGVREGDRRGSNPRPSLEPQFELLGSPPFADDHKSAYSGGFPELSVRRCSPTFARVVVKTVVNCRHVRRHGFTPRRMVSEGCTTIMTYDPGLLRVPFTTCPSWSGLSYSRARRRDVLGRRRLG